MLWGEEFVVGASGGRTQKEGFWGILIWSDATYKKGNTYESENEIDKGDASQ